MSLVMEDMVVVVDEAEAEAVVDSEDVALEDEVEVVASEDVDLEDVVEVVEEEDVVEVEEVERKTSISQVQE